MREISNERRQRDEQEITKRSEKIFDVVAKDKEKYILQRRQTSTLISARSDKATSIIGCRHDGQGTPLRPSPRMACSHNGLIDSGMKRWRNSSIVAARPPQLSHAQKTPPEVRTSFNGSSQRGQMSAVSVVIGYGLHSQ